MSLTSNAPTGALAERWPDWAAGNDRRGKAAIKHQIYLEDHLAQVVARIRWHLPEPKVHRPVERYATRSPNLLKTITDAVAVSYQRGCQRELRGASELVQKAFAEVVAESGIDRFSNGLNARAWILGPTIVSPHLDTRIKLGIDIITPDSVEVKRDGPYLTDVLWRVSNTWIELSADAWRYWDMKGNLEKIVPHAAGVCPAAIFRAVDHTSDWWGTTEHQGLVDATLDVSYKLAFGLFVRQVSGNKLTVVQGNIEDIPAGQSAGEVGGALFINASSAETDVKVLDRIVPAKDHLDEIAAMIALAASTYGIPPGEISTGSATTSGWGGLTVAVRGERLGQLRDKQVPFLRASELELWPLVCDLLRGSPHKHSRILPPGDEVREMLRVSFPDLAPPEDVLARIEAMKAGLPYGLSSPADWMLASRPELTRSEVNELREANLAEYIKTIEPLVSRNIPGQAPAAEGAQTIAQEQGRTGGIKSGEARNEEETP